MKSIFTQFFIWILWTAFFLTNSVISQAVTDDSGVTSDGTYQTFFISEQSGQITVEFDVVPDQTEDIWAMVGLVGDSLKSPKDLACGFVFYGATPQFLVRNGGSWADTKVAFSAGTKYHFRMEVDIDNHKYSVYVTPEFEDEITLATDFSFRSEQMTVTHLKGWGMWSDLDNSIGNITVSNMDYPPPAAVTEATSDGTYQTFFMSEQSGQITVEFDVVPDQTEDIWAMVGLVADSLKAPKDLACGFVFYGATPQFLVRNGGSWADTKVAFSAGTKYHFRMEVDIDNHKYSVYVTPEFEDEITLATDFSFRSEQMTVTHLKGWGMWSDLDNSIGNIAVTNMDYPLKTDDIKDFALETGFVVYPNPFSTTTSIRYNLALPGNVNLSIYNITGKEVAQVVNKYQPVGLHTVQWNGSSLPKGIYLAKLIITGKDKNKMYPPVILTKKIVLMR
ncbi:MAG: T9SS type A sorting domain-containing protein [Mariniphaga sp.]|nr:T9SS type A sorting domain-containing protein [Mariniphaga sp.]